MLIMEYAGKDLLAWDVLMIMDKLLYIPDAASPALHAIVMLAANRDEPVISITNVRWLSWTGR